MKQGGQLELLRNKPAAIVTFAAITRPSLLLVSERHAGTATDHCMKATCVGTANSRVKRVSTVAQHKTMNLCNAGYYIVECLSSATHSKRRGLPVVTIKLAFHVI